MSETNGLPPTFADVNGLPPIPTGTDASPDSTALDPLNKTLADSPPTRSGKRAVPAASPAPPQTPLPADIFDRPPTPTAISTSTAIDSAAIPPPPPISARPLAAAAPPPPAPPVRPPARPGTNAPQTAAPRTKVNHVTLEQLVREAFENNYSDIHLGVGEVPRFRGRGEMVPSSHPVTTEDVFYSWMRESIPESQVEEFNQRMELDTAIHYEGFVRCRVNVFVSLLGPAMVLRLIPLTILTMEQLNLPEVLRDISKQHKGLVLVTGPTGSGKSTTLAAMVDFINRTMAKHLISIEDPIEFVHSSQKSMIRQREVGIHTLEFSNALKASLREDPDIILIGEMRDRETVDTALKAGQTGHLVFGTLHTNSAVKTIERLLNIYNPDEQEPMRLQIAETMVATIAQTLVKTTDGKRAAAHEILVNTDAVKDYIKRGAIDDIEALIPQSTYDGMVTMNQSLYNLYEEGKITAEVALEASPRSNEMSQMLRGRI
ncbi:MAG: type IV pilus twitching motility protein PilT [Synechococcus sp.]